MNLHRHILTFAILSLLSLASLTHAANSINATLHAVPQSSVTGESTIHTITWQTVTPINVRGHIVVSYEDDFGLDQLIMITSYNPATMDGRIEKDSVVTKSGWKHVYMTRKSDGTDTGNGVGLVGVNLALVTNPAAGDYQLRVATYPQDVSGGWVAQDSGATTISIHPPIKSFVLSSGTINPLAGAPFALNVTNAVDQENRPADGIITVSFTDAFANHYAPDGTQPVLVSIPVQNGSGSANQILYKDEPGYIQLKGQVSGGTFSTTTGNLNVFPGDLGRFALAGYPASTVAGTDFGTSTVTVSAYDKWDNLKVNYRGDIYFDSDTDPLADFYYKGTGSPSYYTFTGTDDGVASFPGDYFELRTAGTQTFKVLNSIQTITETSRAIQVTPGAIKTFAFSTVSTRQAGQPFQLSVINAKDGLGNPTSGVINISFATGSVSDHAAPNGQLPILNNIIVANGAGTTSLTLIKAENVQLLGTVSGSNPVVTGTTNQFTVSPGTLGSFVLSGYPNQTQIGLDFPAVTVEARDSYENRKTNFTSQVTFTSNDPAAELPSPYTFQSGDLGRHTFPGTQFSLNTIGDRTITVTSGTVSETSNIIKVTGPNSIILQSVSAVDTAVTRGQTGVTVTMHVINNGTDAFSNYTATLTFKDALQNVVTTDYVVPTATGSIPAASDVTIPFNISVNPNATLGNITIDGSIIGTYPGGPSQATSANIADAWQVQRPANIQILSTTISDTIPKGTSSNILIVQVANNSGQTLSADAVVNSMQFSFRDASLANVDAEFPVTSSPSNPTQVAGGATANFTFYVQSKGTAPTGPITISVQVNYEDANLGQPKSTIQNNAATFESIAPGAIKILSITATDSTVTRGQTKDFYVDVKVENLGGSATTISLVPANTYIKFKLGNQEYISPADIQWPTSPITIPAGSSGNVRFTVAQVQSSVPAAALTILSKITTINGIYTTSELSDVYGTLTVQEPENIVMQSVLPSRETVTINDDKTPWFVKVAVHNSGGSDVFLRLANSTLSFSPGAGFLYDIPTISGDATLTAGETDTLTYRVTRNGSTAGTVTISAAAQYEVINTGEIKNSSGGAQGTVLLQQPGNVVILSTTSTPNAVSQNYSSEWTVAVVVQNQGQAEVDIDVNSDSTGIQFFKDTFEFTNFIVTPPTTLDGKGTTRLAGGESGTLIFNVSPNNPDPGDYEIEATVKSIELNRNKILYSQTTAQTSVDVVTVTTPASISYVANTLSPQQVAPGKGYSFSLLVRNTGSANVELDPRNTTFRLSGGTQNFLAELDPNFATTVPGGDTTLLRFKQTFLSSSFPLNAYVPVVELNGLQHGEPYDKFLNMNGETVTVGEAGDLILDFIRASAKTVTQGQTKSWTVTIGVTNNSTSALAFESAELSFYSLTNEVNDFTVQPPTNLASGNPSLASGQSDSLRFTISKVNNSATLGAIVINSDVTMHDVQDVNNKLSQSIINQASVTVQSPAVMQVLSFVPSQTTITRGQTKVWTVGARVKNNGSSAVKLDPANINLDLVSLGNLFDFQKPSVYVHSGNDILLGNQEDSLYFTIVRVDAGLPLGPVGLVGFLDVKEINTDRSIDVETSQINVTVQEQAQVRLEKVEPMIASNGKVNANGEFYVRALVKNDGPSSAYDHVRKVTVKLSTGIQNGYSFPDGDTTSIFDLAPGETVWTDSIRVRTPLQEDVQGQFVARFSYTEARNTGDKAKTSASADTTFIVTTEGRQNLTIENIVVSDPEVSSGMQRPWTISAILQNFGEGIVELTEPQPSDIQIYDPQNALVNPILYDISVEPLVVHQLGLNDTTTLKFTVSRTWTGGGVYTIKVNVHARELNNLASDINLSRNTSVTLNNSAELYVYETKFDTTAIFANVDAQGIAHVNKGQTFVVSTVIENKSSRYLKEVYVSLKPTGSTAAPAQKVVDLNNSQRKMINFSLTAAAEANLDGEDIVAVIDSAKTTDGGSATISHEGDEIAKIKIHEPAKLQVVSVENLAPNAPKISLGHNFDVRVKVRNNGTEDADNVMLSLVSNPTNLVSITGTPKLLGALPGGNIDSLDFVVSAHNDAGNIDLTAQVVNGFGVNQPANLASIETAVDDTARAHLKPGANLVINKVIPTDSSVVAGDRNNPWYVKAVVSNTGQADLQFLTPKSTDVVFSRAGTIDPDYRVTPPTFLDNAGNLILKAGLTDTLRYTIGPNGYLPGTIDINVTLNAVDLNVIDLVKNPNPNPEDYLTDSGSATIQAEADVQVWIARTQAETHISNDGNGFALVNVGQDFTIAASIQTGQLGGVDSVIVELTSELLTETLFDTIATVDRDASTKALFFIPAVNNVDPGTGEEKFEFKARITHALVKGDVEEAIIRAPVAGADIAKVRVQTQAKLSYYLQVGQRGGALVKTGEIFDVVAKMENLGRAPIGNGKIKMAPPLGYQVKNSQGNFIDFAVEKTFTWPIDQDTLDVVFTMMAPDTTSGPDSIRTELVERPRDLNSDSLVTLGPIDSVVAVTTLDDILKIESFAIVAPEGATDATLSTDQLFTLQAVVRSAQNLKNRQAVLELPTGLGYKFQTQGQEQSIVKITSELETITWIVQAPKNEITSLHQVNLTVTGGDPGVDFVNDEGIVNINGVEKKTSLSLQQLDVTPAGALHGEGIVTFSRGQQATIIARVGNDGAEYYGEGELEIDLGTSNLQLISGQERQPFQENSDVVWQVRAPDLPADAREIFVRVIADSIRDVNSNDIVTIAPASQMLTVFVNEGGSVDVTNLAFYSIDGDVIEFASSEQDFQVVATFETQGVREDGIKASLYSKNSVFKPVDFEKIIPSSGAHVETWTVTAPSHIGNNSDSLYVIVQAIDLQSEEPIAKRSRGLFVPVAERTTFEFDPFISDPIQLKGDDRLSTDQNFSITVDIRHTGADFDVDGNFILRLFEPGDGFELANDEPSWEKTVSARDFKNSGTLPTWRLKAPQIKSDNLSNFLIRVIQMPNDIYSYQEAKAVSRDVTFSVRTLEKAQIYFDGYLHGEPEMVEATVRSGNEFEITALLDNEGEAGLSGEYKVQLLLPDGFNFSNAADSIKTALADSVNKISWMVEAPRAIHVLPDTFWMKILKVPNDALAQKPAELASDSLTYVLVTLEKGAIIVSDYKTRKTTAVIRGRDDVPIMGLNLKNKDASGRTESYINGIRFSVRDKVGKLLSPNSIVSRIAAVRDVGAADTTHADFVFTEQTIFGDSGFVYLDFRQTAGGRPDTLVGNITDNIKLVVDIKPDAKMQDFRFVVDSLTAIDEYDIPLTIADSTGAEMLTFSFVSMMAVMVDESLDKSFFNYPNPFGRALAEYQTTAFTYYLKEPSDVRIHIYTLTGELVKTWNITQAEDEDKTSEGLHQGEIIWDGRNGMGQPVLNGVYLAYILTDYGEQSMTKIAVIR